MILGAPAIIYPKNVLSFFEAGTEIDYEPGISPNFPPIFNLNRPSYQFGEDKRKLRFAEIHGAETAIDAGGPVWNYTSGHYGARVVDYNSNSYKGFRKPSYASIPFQITQDNTYGIFGGTVVAIAPYLETDFRLFTFDGKETPVLPEQAYWLGARRGAAYANNISTIALGQWIRCQIIGSTYIAGNLYHASFKINVERECRIYLTDVDDLTANPTYAFIGSGQTFPVVMKGPGTGTLAVTNGGILLRGSGAQEIILAHTRDAGGPTWVTARGRIDIEVPYDV